MENNYVTLKEIILFVKQIINYSISKWKTVLILSIIGGIIGFGYATFQKINYTSKYTFILNENESNSSVNLSNLAGLVGMGIGSGPAGGINEDKLLFISNSRTLIGKTFLENALINNRSDLLINHFIEINNLSKKFSSDTALVGFTFFTNNKLENLTYKENKVLDIILKIISDDNLLKMDSKKKTGIVTQSSGIILIEFTSIDEAFSKIFIEKYYANICEYYVNKTISKQLKTYNAIKFRADSIKNILFLKENFSANFFDKNMRTIKMQGRLELDRSKRDIELLSLMYAEVLKNQEISKFALDNQTPFFQTVDSPTFPLYKKKTSRLKAAFIVSFICVFIYLVGSFSLNYKKISA